MNSEDSEREITQGILLATENEMNEFQKGNDGKRMREGVSI